MGFDFLFYIFIYILFIFFLIFGSQTEPRVSFQHCREDLGEFGKGLRGGKVGFQMREGKLGWGVGNGELERIWGKFGMGNWK